MLAIAFAAGAGVAMAQRITTVAGSEIGDGGAATAASFMTPTGLAVDSAGQLFISDWDNVRIRKVDGAGIITTVAGNGATGLDGDGEPATMARLHRPEGLAFVSKGDLYFAEAITHRIRKIEFSRTRPASPHDFNADGPPDLLFRDTTSGVGFAWYTQYARGALSLGQSSPAMYLIDPVWEVAQAADWNGDGKPDLLFRSATAGVVFVLYLDGTTLLGTDFVAQVDTAWEIVPRR